MVGISTNSECHVVKNDKTYFYFRRDGREPISIKQEAGERAGLVGWFFLAGEEEKCERRANRKTQTSDFKQTSKKEELQEGDLIKAKGKGIRKLTDLEQKSHPREKKQEPEQQPQPPMWRTRNSIH